MASILDNLRKLTPVKKGDPVRAVASHQRINAMQDLLKSIVRGDNVMSGENVRKRVGEGFFMLSANPRSRSVASDVKALQPFDASDQDGAKVGITFGTIAGLVPTAPSSGSGPNPFIVPCDDVDPNVPGIVYAKVNFPDNGLILGIPETVELSVVEGTNPAAFDEDTANAVFLTIGSIKVRHNGSNYSVETAPALNGSQALVILVGIDGPQPFWAVV